MNFSRLLPIMSALLLAGSAAESALGAIPSNSITINDVGGAGTRPFTISRLFAKGEIPHYPQARLQGVGIPTQSDVKTRWPDGSVQHSMISFVAPVPSGSSLVVDFGDQSGGNNTGALTATQMLATSAYNFGAQIELTNGNTVTANARTMLQAGAFRYWLQGPICTQVIIEDRSTALAYDFGFDALKSLHPIFVATFYPGFAGVKVEMIVENMWATKLEDVSYSVALKTGAQLTTTAYTKPTFVHWAKARWRRSLYSGAAPGAVNIDYNFPYMIYSQALPSFDLTKVVSKAAITGEVNNWLASDQGAIMGGQQIGGQWYNGQWLMAMPTTGGRPDIGLLPRWVVRYLYTMDPSLYQVMMGNAEVSGSVPMHYRETLSKPLFDSNKDGVADTGNSFGNFISIDTRPSVSLSQTSGTLPIDLITAVGALSHTNWIPDLAHHPNFAYVPYLISGDWYFLEELQFWGAWALANNNGTPFVNQDYIRHGNWGYFNTQGIQSRGEAWGMRSLSEAAFLSPDGTTEKAYFSQKVDYNIAVKEGVANITNGSFFQPNPGGTAANPCPAATYSATSATPWCWGYVSVNYRRNNPLFMLDEGVGIFEGLITSAVSAGESPWMWNYKQIVYGHMAELGFPITTLQQTAAKNLLHQILDPAYDPYLTGMYRIPVRDTSGAFFQDWGSVKAAYQGPVPTSFSPSITLDVEHGYAHIARGAASFITNVTDQGLNGLAAWNWMTANVANQDLLNDNPRWAFVPRDPTGPASQPTCDVTGDGAVNTQDVAAMVTEVLGTSGCRVDLDGNGRCDAVDLQRVINASLHQACRVGP